MLFDVILALDIVKAFLVVAFVLGRNEGAATQNAGLYGYVYILSDMFCEQFCLVKAAFYEASGRGGNAGYIVKSDVPELCFQIIGHFLCQKLAVIILMPQLEFIYRVFRRALIIIAGGDTRKIIDRIGAVTVGLFDAAKRAGGFGVDIQKSELAVFTEMLSLVNYLSAGKTNIRKEKRENIPKQFFNAHIKTLSVKCIGAFFRPCNGGIYKVTVHKLFGNMIAGDYNAGEFAALTFMNSHRVGEFKLVHIIYIV